MTEQQTAHLAAWVGEELIRRNMKAKAIRKITRTGPSTIDELKSWLAKEPVSEKLDWVRLIFGLSSADLRFLSGALSSNELQDYEQRECLIATRESHVQLIVCPKCQQLGCFICEDALVRVTAFGSLGFTLSHLRERGKITCETSLRKMREFSGSGLPIDSNPVTHAGGARFCKALREHLPVSIISKWPRVVLSSFVEQCKPALFTASLN